VLAYAVDDGSDGIVTGTHGRTGYERYLTGSVAEKVVPAAEVPVQGAGSDDGDRVEFPH